MRTLIFLILLHNISLELIAQTNILYSELKKDIHYKEISTYIDSSLTSEKVIITGFAFRIYKKTISAQDIGSCPFTPSCSEYGLMTIKKQGFFSGWLNTCDRLSRCNKHAHLYHTCDTLTYQLLDPVRNIRYELE